jgi:hypothetical protein
MPAAFSPLVDAEHEAAGHDERGGLHNPHRQPPERCRRDTLGAAVDQSRALIAHWVEAELRAEISQRSPSTSHDRWDRVQMLVAERKQVCALLLDPAKSKGLARPFPSGR